MNTLVSSCDLGTDDTGWVIDVVGRVWFTTGVTTGQPTGSGQWFQVSVFTNSLMFLYSLVIDSVTKFSLFLYIFFHYCVVFDVINYV